MGKVPDSDCSIARSLGVLGERWTFLILRDAFLGATKFAEFRDRLGVAPDMLSDRLSTPVEYGLMEREPYQEPGARPRFSYRRTQPEWNSGWSSAPCSSGATSTCHTPMVRAYCAGPAVLTCRYTLAMSIAGVTR